MKIILALAVVALLVVGCGPNRWLTPEYTYYVKIENSPGAVVVLPFWSGDMPSTEKYDTTQTPQFSAEIPLVPRGKSFSLPLPGGGSRSFEVPPDTGTFIIVWSSKGKAPPLPVQASSPDPQQ